MKYRILATGIVVWTLSLAVASSPASAAKQPANALKSKLLTVSQLPIGWTLNKNTGPPPSSSCYSNPLWKVAYQSKADVEFGQGEDTELVEQLAAYKNGKTSFSKVIHELNSCSSFTETAQGETVKGTLGATSFPTEGNQSRAYTATLTIEGEQLQQIFVITRVGNVVAGIALAGFTPDPSQLETFVTKGLKRIGFPATTSTT